MSKITFTRAQAEFLKEKLGSETLKEAIERFVELMKIEGIGSDKVLFYLERLMRK